MLKSEPQFFSMPPRKSTRNVFKILRSEARQKRLRACIEGVRDEAGIFCSLFSLALVSEKLSLDKYGIFYVCDIGRSGRKSASSLLNRAAELGILRRTTECPMWPKDSLKSRKTKGCPPVLIREYRRHELRKVKRRGLDLAVIFDSGKTYFPRTWDGMRVCGRTLRVLGRIRNSYQFCTENIGWMLSIVKSLADVSLDRRSILAKHVHYQIDRINYQLWSMIECYSLDAKYAEAFARLKSQEELQALMYIGFSLVDPLKMATLKW